MHRRLAYVALFGISGSVLAFEVSLTRICSVLLQYHISFAVVSLAVLGLGLGGFLASRSGAAVARQAAGTALLALPLSIPLALGVLLRTPFASWWPLLLFLLLPVFIAAGVFQAILFRELRAEIGRLYAADLAGGALGALLSVVAIQYMKGPIVTSLSISLVLCGLAWLWCRDHLVGRAWRGWNAASFLLISVLTAGHLWGDWLDVDYDLAPQKLITAMAKRTPAGQPVFNEELQRWDAYSRVDVLDLHGLGGTTRAVFIDGETPTSMLQSDHDAPGASKLPVREALPAFPYRVLQPKQILSIGSGAGYDVVVAKLFGAEHVDAVELNAGVLDIVEKERDFTGDVYGASGVHVHHAEGRLFASAQEDDRYDLLVMVLAQSLAGNMQEYALSENYLYTRQAFEEYFRVLRHDGCLALFLSNRALLRRLTRTANDVLAKMEKSPRERLIALSSPSESPYGQMLLVCGEPLTAGQQRLMQSDIESHAYDVLVAPWTGEQPFRQFISDAHLRLQPATDDWPFFFNVFDEMPRGLVILLVSSSLLLLLGLVRLRSADLRAGIFFSLLGTAFMIVEVVVLQKTILVIGFPTLNLAVVLATFLAFAGLGSAASTRLSQLRHLQWSMLLLVILLTLLLFILNYMHENLSTTSTLVRCLVVVAVLFPYAFLMGIPFPLALRLLPQSQSARVPWFWGLNGIASVLGSGAAVAIVLEVGFRATIAWPASLYLLAAILSGFITRRA